MEQEQYLERGIVQAGCRDRLQAAMEKAAKGESVGIAFLGGSVTMGSVASTPRNGYAYLVFQWWKETFTASAVRYINGGIGGTSSHFGVARAQQDVLDAAPDVVFVDFCVNDAPDDFFEETFEGVIRKLLAAPTKPAVVILNNVYYDTGCSAQERHNRIGAHYGVPCVSVRDSIWAGIQDGVWQRQELTPDGLHPNDKGHRLLADTLIYFLEKVRGTAFLSTAELRESGVSADAAKKQLPDPLTANAYEHSRLLQKHSAGWQADGFFPWPTEKKGMMDVFAGGWLAEHTGDWIRFSLEGSCIAVQYRRYKNRQAPKAIAIVDGDESSGRLLDGNYDQDWGDLISLDPVLHHGKNGKHTLEIRLIGAEGKVVNPFCLIAIVVS